MMNYLNKVDNEEILEKLYRGDLYPIEQVPNTEEYNQILKEIALYEKDMLGKINETEKKKFNDYLEKIESKQSIEAENQFKLGFKNWNKINYRIFIIII